MKFANCHDTLLAHHAFASHLPQSLSHVAACYTDSRPWKRIFKSNGEDEKGQIPRDMNADDLCKYNAADAALTMLAWQRMQPDLLPEMKVYEHDRKLAAICREMTVAGIGVDISRKEALSDELAERRSGLRSRLQELTGDPDFNPGKLDAVRNHLFQTLGARYVAVTKTGKASTANSTLEAMRLSGNQDHVDFAEALLLWRLVGKVKSTYVDIIGARHDKGVHLTGDNRAHYNWKPFGTVSGRLSCRLQSAPRYKKSFPEHRVRELYVPAPGNVFVYYDVSQAEMRLAAYLSNDPVFIAACACRERP